MDSHVDTRAPFDIAFWIDWDRAALGVSSLVKVEGPEKVSYGDPENLATNVVTGTFPK